MIEKFESLKLGESCHLQSFAFLTGLVIDEMHLAVEVSMRNTDKYLILENIVQMIEEAKNQKYRFNTMWGKEIDPQIAVLKLEDLRRWFIMEYCYDAVENCNKIHELQCALEEKSKEITELKATHKNEMEEVVANKDALKAELDTMKKYEDEWGSRVTYENVVDQIALYEDPSQRDEARKIFAPLLKKNMVTKMHRDIKRRAKELNGDGGTNILIGKVEGDLNMNKTVRQIDN